MSERIKCSDDDIMIWGKYKDKRLGDIPSDYWVWFLDQPWRNKWPDLVKYAELCEEENDDDE